VLLAKSKVYAIRVSKMGRDSVGSVIMNLYLGLGKLHGFCGFLAKVKTVLDLYRVG
jgi:hypothetical protein